MVDGWVVAIDVAPSPPQEQQQHGPCQQAVEKVYVDTSEHCGFSLFRLVLTKNLEIGNNSLQ